ncbi:lytic transglycosylase F [Bradyrhizobium sp. CCGUVB14]|uniref:transglycosylase SLT domain-containing protein n=1 Tax=Bradyrhizobium sp. CCGUVB14 TaxID=2949628 RepID=UPI0020B243F3|nr:lytic transglycosylase F [Bradyrhizobium sp. CCGUVB14]MCP3443855.1 lytic transglycosylase F [Bradyrhizobium sp. CCGUVB14]
MPTMHRPGEVRRARVIRPLLPLLAAALIGAHITPALADQPVRIIGLPAVPVWTGDFDGMKDRKLVRILVPFSRTSFFLDKGEAFGFEAELGQEFETWLNKRYGKKPYHINVVFIPTPRDRLFDELRAGKGDIAAGNLTITAERASLVDFAAPWATNVKEVLVTGPAAPAIAGLDDLAATGVTTRLSSSYFTHLKTINEQRKQSGKAPIKLDAADENLQDEDLLEMVGGGLLPWVVVDRHKAVAWSGLLKGLKVREDITINDGGELAWALRKDSPLLTKELNEFVAGHRLGTEFGNNLKARYVTNAKAIKNAIADAGKLQALVAAFTEYGGRYAIDPMLLAAQGYQESGFDQKMRNSSGAVGIMQIKPSTAHEKQIAINDVTSRAEDNIHAGAKYLRFLADTYIAEPAVEAREQVLMALAAYNAGPGNLKKFRDFASKHGLDRNRWFGNVENGAAAIVGQETVGYIGNIYKYYVVYAAQIKANEEAAKTDAAAKP